MGNLPLSSGQLAERRINTECGRVTHVTLSKDGDLRNLSLEDEPAYYQLVGKVMAYQG